MLTRVDSLALAELESAHCYAAEFGTVLEWCAHRTDALFASPTEAWLSREDANELDRSCDRETPWNRAELAFFLVREARRVERRFSGEVA